jgi:tyrosyl-tRNA synthetase
VIPNDDALNFLLRRGVAEIVGEDELIGWLKSGRMLRLKEGFDPSKPNLHVGHAVTLRKLRQFQELGHQVVLIVGDWTAQIGDPSGRDQSRQRLNAGEVRRNAETYMQQFFSIVDRSKTEVRWQSEWFGKFTLTDVFELTAKFTLADIMAHETFRLRWDNKQPLSLMELLYPLLQGYDSIAIDSDVEFGGTDQKFNILVGRQLQQMMGKRGQAVFLPPRLAGTDGRKMSKSFLNTVDLIDPPGEMYGKLMRMSDEVLPDYFSTLTDIPEDDLVAMQLDMVQGRLNPRDAKMRLAREIVAQFHSRAAAQADEDEFVKVFQKHNLPSDMQTVAIAAGANVSDFLMASGLASSKSEARRLIQQGGVSIDGDKVLDGNVPASPGVWRVGPRRFVRAT